MGIRLDGELLRIYYYVDGKQSKLTRCRVLPAKMINILYFEKHIHWIILAVYIDCPVRKGKNFLVHSNVTFAVSSC